MQYSAKVAKHPPHFKSPQKYILDMYVCVDFGAATVCILAFWI